MNRHSKMESDTDSTTSQSSSLSSLRLGKCEVCNYQDAKYTCPKCEIKTCCLNCLNIHKKELNCNGIRDRTKYKSLKEMSKIDFMSDYYFLEECTRYVADRKNDKIKRYTRYNNKLPSHLFKLRNAALERKTTLKFLLKNFTRHSSNTTFYDWKLKLIQWRVEWIFVNAGHLKFVDERCNEDESLKDLLDKYLNTENCEALVPMKKSLEIYQSYGIGNLKVLLKAEGIKRCRNRFYELDCTKTLRQNLTGKTLVEFPVIYICYDVTDAYDIIDSDEDVEAEARQYQADLDNVYRQKFQEGAEKNQDQSKKETEEKIKEEAVAKKRADRVKRRVERKNQPTNFLFADESLWDDLSSDSESEEETKKI